MRHYDAYLLDLYGTLVDIRTDEAKTSFWQGLADFFSQAGAFYSFRELRSTYLSLCAKEETALQRSFGCDDIEIDLSSVFSTLYREKGISAGRRLIEETASEFRRRSTARLRLYAGAKELLLALRKQGSLVILLSNAQSLFTKPEMDRLGLSGLFDGVFLSSEIGFKKPDRRFFESPLARFGLNPSDCLMIGNDPVCDILGAKDMGMDSVFIRSALSPRREMTALPCVFMLDGMDLKRLRRVLTGNTPDGIPKERSFH